MSPPPQKKNTKQNKKKTTKKQKSKQKKTKELKLHLNSFLYSKDEVDDFTHSALSVVLKYMTFILNSYNAVATTIQNLRLDITNSS